MKRLSKHIKENLNSSKKKLDLQKIEKDAKSFLNKFMKKNDNLMKRLA